MPEDDILEDLRVMAGLRVLLIPGIGGHPAFHRSLISRLEAIAHVTTAPHGDFKGEAYSSFGHHLQYWEEVAGLDPYDAVVGISFGAHVAAALFADRRVELGRLVCVSPPFLGRGASVVFAIVRLAPVRAAALLAGLVLFRWSDAAVDDKASLVRFRRQHYDGFWPVSLRLWFRLICLSQTDTCTQLSRISKPVLLIQGNKDILCQMRCFDLDKMPNVAIKTIDGDHSISNRICTQLEDSIERFITGKIQM